jgi:glutamate--cysteine ligase
MSNPGDADSTPITSLKQLADYIAVGCKPAERFRMGTEHEKFGFRLGDLATPPYEPTDGQPGSIRGLLEGLLPFDGTPITDTGNIIGVKQGDAAISLEPAGQLELSGAPVETLHQTMAELEAHYDQVRSVSRDLQIGFAPLGFHPTGTREQMPWMPKSRYAIMRRYMPKVGTLGLDMMTRTCTVQVNLDYASEQDMLRKLRVSLLLQPLATALFANSPFSEGRPNGIEPMSGPTPTTSDPAYRERCSNPASASSATSSGWSITCRCTSFIVMAHTSTWPARRSEIS